MKRCLWCWSWGMPVRWALMSMFGVLPFFLHGQTITAPSFSGPPADRVELVGNSVQFQLFASGTGPITYQWLKNGTPLANGGSILGATGTVLQISNLQRSDDAFYSLRATNSAGSTTSGAAHLTVRELRIVTPPASQTVAPGGTATFSVTVSATDPISYQWYKNGNRITGATGATLTISNASASDVASYWVDVTTVVNTIGSGSATLTVTAPPQISFQPTDASRVVGQFVGFQVSAIGQTPFTYQWYKNGSAIAGATGASYGFEAQFAEAGNYHVVVTNPSGSVTSRTAVLTVFDIIISGPREKVYDGTPLTVTATTNPAGLPVTLRYSYTTGFSLTAPPVAAGFYSVNAIVFSGIYSGGVSAELRVTPVPLTVTFGNLLQTYDGNPHPVTTTTNPPNIPLTLEYGGPNAPPPIAAGSYEILAISGNSNYLPTTTQRATLVIAKAAQTITFSPLSSATVGTPIALQATASSGLTPVTFSVIAGNATLNGANLTVQDTTPVTVRATQSGNSNYLAGTADYTFSLGKQNQSISFAALADRTRSAAPQTLAATSSSGLPVTLSVVAGPATLSGNTLTLSGATGTVIVRATQGGDATYNAAPAIERSFTVTTAPAPTIQVQPASQAVRVGASVTFSVTATGSGPLRYQWLRNGVSLGNFSTPTLTLNSVGITDSGAFSVIVSDGDAFTTSVAATLTVDPAEDPSALLPVVINQTASQAVQAGASAHLLVTPGGTPPIYYQWRKDGVPIAGATNSSYFIANFQAANAGAYTVALQNSAGTIVGPVITLTLQAGDSSGPPAIILQPSASTLATGSTATFSVGATGAAPLSYQWRKDDTPIAGATSAFLTLAPLKLADAGRYSVVVSNNQGSVTSASALLTLLDPPRITTQPVSRTVSVGASVAFSATVTGTPPFSYHWKKDGNPIPGGTGATLTLTNVQLSDAGRYSVEVSNAIGGSFFSDPAVLTVTNDGPPLPAVVAPVITTQPSSLAVDEGRPARIGVVAIGTTPLTYQWRRNGVDLAGATSDVFSLAAVRAGDAGNYTVVVRNSAGSVTSSGAVLTVNGPSLAGTYFGVFPNAQGSWALYVRMDRTAVFIAYLAGLKNAVVQNLVVGADGGFSAAGTAMNAAPVSGSAEEPRRAAAASFVLSGRISDGQVTGELSGLGMSFSGVADTAASASAGTGYYTAPSIGTSSGATHAVVGPSGRALVVTANETTADAASGVLDRSGRLTATTAGGAQLALQIDTGAATISGAVSGGAAASTFAGLADGAISTSRLINLSVRSVAGAGEQTLAVGFVAAGSGTKQVLLRGIGPTLAQFAVSGALARPELQLFDSRGQLVQRNAGWGGNGALATTFTRLGAFPLASNSDDAAMMATLQPGPNTAQIVASSGARGVALIEAYDADDDTAPAVRLINLSARTEAGTGVEALTVGFVLTGNAPATLLVRGIGPTLAQFRLSGVLADPELTVFDGERRVLARNNDWAGAGALAAAFTQVGAFPLAANSKDAAVLVTLLPGAYTAQVNDTAGRTGAALIEVYELR